MTKKIIIVSCDTNSYPSMHYHGYIDNKEDFDSYVESNGLSDIGLNWDALKYEDCYRIQDVLNDQEEMEFLIRLVE